MILGKYVPVGSLSDADLLLPSTTTASTTPTAVPISSQQGVSDETTNAITSVVGVGAQVDKVNDMTSIFTEISTAHSNFTAPSPSASKQAHKRPLEQQQATMPATKTANYAVSFDDDEDDDDEDNGDGDVDVQQKSHKLSSSSTIVGVKKASAPYPTATAAIIHRDIFASDVSTAPLTAGAGEKESTHHRKFPKGSKGSGDGGDKPPLSRKQQQDIEKRRAGNSTSSSSPKLNRAARRALGKGE